MKFILPISILFFALSSSAASLVCHSELSVNNGAIHSSDDLTQPLGGPTTESTASTVLANYRADIAMTHLDSSLPNILMVVYKDNQAVGSVPVPIGMTGARNFSYDDFSIMTSCFVRQ